ncbi:MAG: PQ-loop domain-containing transporter [Spiroplasma sp.]|nr:PQ-loop domain-containing transporter [Spiroplasma sp.]
MIALNDIKGAKKMTIFIAIIGYLAGFLAVITFIPQAIKTIKTRDTKEISLKTYLIYNLANFLFLLLAILSIALPIMHPDNAKLSQIIIWAVTLILPYSVTIIGVSCIIAIKLQNMRKFGEVANKVKIKLPPKNNQENNHVI